MPMTMSTLPVGGFGDDVARCSLSLRKRESISTRTGKPASRSRKVLKCCCARTVVGTSTATCLPSITALKAARTATSVLP